mmetsp:Transcript_6296/g.19007  ORF Transcript_6296/g.19007 Transcript_6296/m.19007 type:complete len:488 (-) Transcript_6296:31-1494(-)|eukprot:CAMPEP_0198725450 /NCGR_PEP_ID=MMETSP1475-20131203/2758_1 /TAXON_ID= ORGANISM="Unidentified sp., Strain CCMP1999" /NCGR_SAMPLE_ID=MMETSP1475 /ASSEMBLY_ACC=CAM_ASM_001111 /LENGTH=487 /DNA_ID=CAMNT_0044487233 /DNA_START=100 /DNA_END=1563 /DNA_ORIENTATION=+
MSAKVTPNLRQFDELLDTIRSGRVNKAISKALDTITLPSLITKLITDAGRIHSAQAARKVFFAFSAKKLSLLNRYHVAAVIPYLEDLNDVQKIRAEFVSETQNDIVLCNLYQWYKGRGKPQMASKVLSELESLNDRDPVKRMESLAACYRMESPDKVTKLWKQAKDHGIALKSIMLTSTIASALCDFGEVSAAEDIVASALSAKELRLDQYFFNIALKIRAKRGDQEGIFALTEKMKELRQPPTLTFFGTLIEYCAEQRDTNAAELILTEMEKQGLRPNSYIHSSLIRMYAKSEMVDKLYAVLGNIYEPAKPVVESALRAFLQLRDREGLLRVLDYAAAKKFDFFKIECNVIATFGLMGHYEDAEIIFERLTRDQQVLWKQSRAYNAMLFAYSASKKFHLFDDLESRMRQANVNIDAFTYQLLVHRWTRTDSPDKVILLHGEMMQKEIKPTKMLTKDMYVYVTKNESELPAEMCHIWTSRGRHLAAA